MGAVFALFGAGSPQANVVKIFHCNGTVSSAVVILSFWLNMRIEVQEVQGDESYLALNPTGKTPALLLSNGDIVSEIPLIMTILCDQAVKDNTFQNSVSTTGAFLLVPPNTPEWTQLNDILMWLSTELNSNLVVLFESKVSSNAVLRDYFLARVVENLNYVESLLSRKGKLFLLSDSIHCCDLLLYSLIKIAFSLSISIESLPLLRGYFKRITIMPKIIGAESLLPRETRRKR